MKRGWTDGGADRAGAGSSACTVVMSMRQSCASALTRRGEMLGKFAQGTRVRERAKRKFRHGYMHGFAAAVQLRIRVWRSVIGDRAGLSRDSVAWI